MLLALAVLKTRLPLPVSVGAGGTVAEGMVGAEGCRLAVRAVIPSLVFAMPAAHRAVVEGEEEVWEWQGEVVVAVDG